MTLTIFSIVVSIILANAAFVALAVWWWVNAAPRHHLETALRYNQLAPFEQLHLSPGESPRPL